MKDVKQSNRLRILAAIQKINGITKLIGDFPESKRNKLCESFMYDDFVDDITEILLSTLVEEELLSFGIPFTFSCRMGRKKGL